MASSDSDFSDVEVNSEVDDGEGIVNEGLPSGSERDLIEYYFNRGLTYRQITLMLENNHLDMERTYIETKTERLWPRRRDAVDDEVVERVKEYCCPKDKNLLRFSC